MQLPRPLPWEMLIALAGAAALVGDALYRGSGSVAIAIPLALIACLPLAWSSEKPLTALLATTAGLVVCLAVFQPYHTAIVVLAAALYNVATLGDLRATLDLLRDADDPAPTAPTLDLASLTQLLDRAKAAGLDADANVQLNGHTMPIAVGQAGFRIVQEALTNVMRHAAASRARVNLRVELDTLHVEVTDDGNAAAATASGHGLR